MNLENRKILVLGGYGLVGMAVCRELLIRKPREIQIHSLRIEESEKAAEELRPEANSTALSTSAGNIFGLVQGGTRRDRIRAELRRLDTEDLGTFVLYDVLTESKPDVVIDCVNTSTGIAYGDIFRSAEEVLRQLGEEGGVDADAAEQLLDSLYMPRLIRHIQIMYRGMIDAGTRAYVKVGTTGTGGMGLNIPYTHSEERPSRVLLSKSALAGAQSMLLFLMARTPGAPITKEIKPAAAIAWKKMGYGPIYRGGKPLQMMDARPIPLGATFSTEDPGAAQVSDELYQNVFIDTGENGVFSLEEFATVTSHEQMEFVTPEEIARYLVFEIEGRGSGYDIVNALDAAVLGPTYRAGILRHWALERLNEMEREHGVRSVAFEMLGPPRNSKLLFEAHLLRQAYPNMDAVRRATPEQVCATLDRLVREKPEEANQVVSVGVPILLNSGEILRGVKVLVPSDAAGETVTPEKLEEWVRDGWVDLRLANCAKWVERFQRISDEIDALPEGDSSSRYLRNRRFWHKVDEIQPGKVVGWILGTEEGGSRNKR
ncbi:MAG TPA: short-chain dehydrogenase [Thermoanaerobaculia bacterium]|nr:short-chain dehydrogenase [Thermoanaerobaculia bacterium]